MVKTLDRSRKKTLQFSKEIISKFKLGFDFPTFATQLMGQLDFGTDKTNQVFNLVKNVVSGTRTKLRADSDNLIGYCKSNFGQLSGRLDGSADTLDVLISSLNTPNRALQQKLKETKITLEKFENVVYREDYSVLSKKRLRETPEQIKEEAEALEAEIRQAAEIARHLATGVSDTRSVGDTFDDILNGITKVGLTASQLLPAILPFLV